MVKSNVHIVSEFGALVVSRMIPTIHDFDVTLSQSEAIIKGSIFGDISKLDIHTNEKDY